ncbi:hypothetical protein CN345_09240 [Bacillus thuringiensis]|uniref:insecticidal delta-endotoxin Cry8Ea1 family protein n=1 Tax=Bacillus thuringiensis TaxID=1428 RepID=UPI0009AB1C26|nr:insecticidal delta-endotoxin Cry8Ea1 family protein [Bacillus thuringiensis]PEZ39117.1 hypothetical protein CN345_09240 [Bacillus thuringiensis]PGY63215.1 hypothetical protein COE09_02465 [Bacillus thuringiensis]
MDQIYQPCSFPYNVLAQPINLTDSAAFYSPTILGTDDATILDKILEDIKKYYTKGTFASDFAKTILPLITQHKINWSSILNIAFSFTSSIPFVGTAVSILSPFLQMLFPSDPAAQSRKIMEEILTQTEAMINQQIGKTELDRITQNIVGLGNVLSHHNQTISQIANLDPSKVFNTIEAIADIFIVNIPQLVSLGYIPQTLPLFVQGVNLYFMFLKTTIESADLLKLTEGEITFFKTALQEAIPHYTTEVVQYFNRIPDSSKTTEIRNAMQINCFDFVALWPVFNPDYYPTQTDIEQTRLLFEKSGYGESDGGRVPTPYDDSVGYRSDLELTNIVTRGADRVDFVQEQFANGTTISGGSGLGYQFPDFPSSRNNPVIDIYESSTNGEQYQAIHYKAADGTLGPYRQTTYDLNPPPGQKIYYTALGTHNFMGVGQVGPILSMFIPINLFPENIIGVPDSETGNIPIKGIPFEKGHTEGLRHTREEVNAASAVVLEPGQSITLPITCITTAVYQLRIRYAYTDTSGNKRSLPITISTTIGDLNDTKMLEHTAENPLGVVGNNGTYIFESKPSDVYLSTGNVTVQIINKGRYNLFLDRLDFVPLRSSSSPFDKFSQDFNDMPPNIQKTIWFGPTAQLVNINGYVFAIGDRFASISLQFWNKGKFVKSLPPTPTEPSPLPGSVPIYYMNEPIGDFDTITIIGSVGTVTGHIEGNAFQENASVPTNLDEVTRNIQNLFSFSNPTILNTHITNRMLNEVFIQIKNLPSTTNPTQIRFLREQLNRAKELYRQQNLILNGDFDSLSAWMVTPKVSIIKNIDSSISNILFLPPPTLSPSYALQKIEETTLKENTRYTISGFIKESSDLRLFISRYQMEIDTTLDVPFKDTNEFQYSIDVGTLDIEQNIGIGIGFMITSAIGFARIENVMIKEERPLTTQEIQAIQYKIQKWKNDCQTTQQELETLLEPAVTQINQLYYNADWNSNIYPTITYQDLYNIVLPQTTESDVIQNRISLLQQAVNRAFDLLDSQNLIVNGRFLQELTNWNVQGTVNINTTDYPFNILELTDWDANVSQSITLPFFNPNQPYKLRVYAQGQGSITVTSGMLTTTLTFDSSDFTLQESDTIYFNQPTVEITIQSEGAKFLIQSIELFPNTTFTSLPNTSSNN